MEISDEEQTLYMRMRELQTQLFSPNKQLSLQEKEELAEKSMQWRIDMDEYRSRL
jgi:hypothetical protein|tara:strand:- start:8879 stop:9043 length:165 start_codon:yes stop_codon:yes gene_type:complete